MGKISPFGILRETFANAFRWVHLFLPIALVAAVVGVALNGYLLDSLMASTEAATGAVPSGLWTSWLLIMIGILATQVIQLSLYDAVMERQAGWMSFGLSRALRRLIPALLGMVLFMLAYLVGVILLIIPGVMALFLLYMMLPLILLDGVGPFAALKKSWQLTWGNAWRLFGAILLTFLPVMLGFWVLAFALGLVSSDPAQPMLLPSTAWSDWRTWANVLLTGVMGMLVASFYLVAFRALKPAQSGEGDMVPEAVTA